MTVPGKGDSFKKSPRTPSSVPSSSSISISLPIPIGTANRAHSIAISMLPSPTRIIIKTLLKTILHILFKLWRWASSFLILIFFAAWFYGGFLPYFLFLIAVLSLGYHVSDYLLYQPDFPQDARHFVPSPAQYGLPFEEISIQTKDRVKLHAYLIKQKLTTSRNLPTIIFFHGNAGNIGNRLENAKVIYKELQCNCLLVEYRGYGRSEGTPSEKGLYQDAQAAFEFVESREDLDSKKIILFGRSLGGAVAIDLAARCDFRDRVKALVVENSFTSIPAIAKHLFPIRAVRWLPTFCYKNKYESCNKVTSIVCPTLFISGTEDELIPPSMMKELHIKCSSHVKRLYSLPGGHNDTWTCKDYCPRFRDFLAEALQAGENGKSPEFHAYSDNVV